MYGITKNIERMQQNSTDVDVGSQRNLKKSDVANALDKKLSNLIYWIRFLFWLARQVVEDWKYKEPTKC